MPETAFDVEARYASLEERVRGQGSQITAIQQEMHSSFAKLASAVDAINTKVADTNKPQGQALGVMLTAVVVVGTLAYWPIREAQARIEQNLAAYVLGTDLRFKEVLSLQQFQDFKSTYENNRTLVRVDNNARFEKVERGVENSLSRSEHELQVQSLHKQFEDIQRQLNEIKSRSP